ASIPYSRWETKRKKSRTGSVGNFGASSRSSNSHESRLGHWFCGLLVTVTPNWALPSGSILCGSTVCCSLCSLFSHVIGPL
ncbi:hypothetical protein L6452_10506, partial [Arctium lappa]